MRIVYLYRGKEGVFERGLSVVTVGRPKAGVAVDLDLSPDEQVSRPHARLYLAGGIYWIEDLGSLSGTRVNDVEIKGREQQPLRPGDVVKVGETTLSVLPALADAGDEGDIVTQSASDVGEGTTAFRGLPPEIEEVTETLDDALPADENIQRLGLFYELATLTYADSNADALWQQVVTRIVEVIPGARRGALLIRERDRGQLLRKASLPPDNPAVSTTLAERAMRERCPFIWSKKIVRQDEPDAASGEGEWLRSAVEYKIESAMYAPLLWKDQSLGVICVDNHEARDAFRADDLRLFQACAQVASIAIANSQLQEELKRESKVLSNLLKLTSPQLAGRLRLQRGEIRLGGEFHDATIMFSDLRGFTSLAGQMEPDEVTDMLEDYFGRLVPIVFEHHGLVDKFVGDAIVAVFGSPDQDDAHHRHAIESALRMQDAMREVNARRAARGKQVGELGVGIHCGPVIHGFIGSRERMEFTVIGDAVNRASRYCDGAAGGEVLISEDVYQQVWAIVEVEQTSILTKHEGELRAFRVKRLKGDQES
jgi:class 3 adenylate cyclase